MSYQQPQQQQQQQLPPMMNGYQAPSGQTNGAHLPPPAMKPFNPMPPMQQPPYSQQQQPQPQQQQPQQPQQQQFQNYAMARQPGHVTNGISGNSSRTASPALNNGPPMSNMPIPASQLPPSRSTPNFLYGQTNANPTHALPATQTATHPQMVHSQSVATLNTGPPPSNLAAGMQNMSLNGPSAQLPQASRPPTNFVTNPMSRPPVSQMPPTTAVNGAMPPPPQTTAAPMMPQATQPPPPMMYGQHSQVAQPQPVNKRPMYPPTQTLPPVQPPMPGYQQQQQQQQQQQPMAYNGQQQQQPMASNGQQQQQQQQQPPRMQYQNFNQQPMQAQPQQYNNAYGTAGVTQSGFNRMWGNETMDLMQNRHVLPTDAVQPPVVKLTNQFHEALNCSSDIFRCTLTKIPESNNLLQKSRLPLGILIHPFRDLTNLPVISCSTIVRCRACRTYINPFVYFVDSKKWKCNLCYRVNELPDEFQYNPVTKAYGDPTGRPEIKSSTIEFIAPSEYMLRPPQPAIYLFLLDVSSIAQQSGYLQVVCDTLTQQLDYLPGDARTQVGFIAYNSGVHFYNIAEWYNQPHEITMLDVEDPFVPFPDGLLINLQECKELIKDLLAQLPKRFDGAHDNKSALGAALQVAFKLMSATGGRITVFQTCLPNYGPGALQSREDPNNRSSKDVAHLGPATDFYKRLALECSGQQIAVDVFLLNNQYSDMATLSGISKFSGGCLYHFPLFNVTKHQQNNMFQKSFTRYLTRKIGFEAVMRVRCTRGLAIHTFHGNFFVRSTDLLSLPNVNPDAGFGMQITYEENLTDVKTVCFQAALLYTSSKAERRIRVHTLCLPVTASLTDVLYSADVQCIVGLLAKMAVDRSLTSNLADARDAFINATVDVLSAFRVAQNLPNGTGSLVASQNLALLPLYILALLKHTAFRIGVSTRLDDRVFAMCEMKSLPLDQLMRYIYPDFYLLDSLFMNLGANNGENNNGEKIQPPRLQLSAEKFDSRSLFLLDNGTMIYIYVGTNVQPQLLKNLFSVDVSNQLPDACELKPLETDESKALMTFIESINEEKPVQPLVYVLKDTSQYRSLFVEHFVDDRNESSLSYYEFLQHLKTQIK